MENMKGWNADFGSTTDRDYDFVDIFFDETEVATIKKVNGQIVVSWHKSESSYDIPLDWFLGLLQEAKSWLG